MLNVKNKLLPILCLALCLCIVWGSATTAYASDVAEENTTCKAQFEAGDTFILRCDTEYSNNGHKTSAVITGTITDSNKYMCFYLKDDSAGVSTSGKVLGGHYDVPNATVEHTFSNANWNYTSDGLTPVSDYCFPILYHKPDTSWVTDKLFYTNIPIFETQEDALAYRSGEISVNDAINYGKELVNGSWVRAFEDIEINDSDILVPQLSNITHTGFTIENLNDDRYCYEIYMQSGIEKPEIYMDGTMDVSDALFVNEFGLISDNTETAYSNQNVDIAMMYGIDNVTALTNSMHLFYTTYPSAKDYFGNAISEYPANNNYHIWAKPFGKKGIFFTNSTKVTDSELSAINISNCDICYTQYRVRFYYYDDASGFHYGPWGIYTYFSQGKVAQSSIFQSNTGNIIETPMTQGSIDVSTGNITYVDDTNYIDLNNPNNLFGYIRSVTNNVSATMGNFSTLFATMFTFIPADVQGMIWLGVAVMVIIGVIKVIKG